MSKNDLKETDNCSFAESVLLSGTEKAKIDALMHQDNMVGTTRIAPAPVGKHLWGTVTIGNRGQIVIPKAARDIFDLKSGDRLIVLGDEEEGIALVKAEEFEEKIRETLKLSQQSAENE